MAEDHFINENVNETTTTSEDKDKSLEPNAPFINDDIDNTSNNGSEVGQSPPSHPRLGNKPFETYSIIIETRKFEIENFWKRAYFFWGFITVIAGLYVGLFIKIQSAKDPSDIYIFFSFNLSLIICYLCFLFSLNARSGKFWQIHWENLAVDAEKRLSKNGNIIDVFGKKPDDQVICSDEKKFSIFTPIRTSVSKLTFLIGDLMVFVWLLLTIKDAYYIYQNNIFCLNNNVECSFSPTLTISILILLFILFQILMLFLNKTRKPKNSNN